ncbi:hypothetical protein MGG_16214 [Pyricularia oryzae 70-15]|uniref:Uncharacterized protein n=1 Tax=Pyricularia oryzae (strain 70-15 / ATCC MYA-4617 / FGSC 8958) TaxID=242507 RepID=G4MND4_PYRO7|nr:uncharacterized protein MGG_16214 [Pyricularia oryzae 70-15]EHA57048.1 hypothetical protein MGG_16214 [Pyricularia oryzae 70-15]
MTEPRVMKGGGTGARDFDPQKRRRRRFPPEDVLLIIFAAKASSKWRNGVLVARLGT